MLKLIRSIFTSYSKKEKIEEEQIEDGLLEELDTEEAEEIDIEIENEPENLIQSSVTFVVSKHGSIDIHISWSNNESITAQNLSMLLYIINSGGFEQHCKNLLVNIANTQPDNTSFIKECLDLWDKKRKKDTLIKPSEVFQFGTLNME